MLSTYMHGYRADIYAIFSELRFFTKVYVNM